MVALAPVLHGQHWLATSGSASAQLRALGDMVGEWLPQLTDRKWEAMAPRNYGQSGWCQLELTYQAKLFGKKQNVEE